MQSRLHIDVETASELSLTAAGHHLYSEHPSTRLLSVAWALDDQPIKSWQVGQPNPRELFDIIMNHRFDTWEAHNAQFENSIFNRHAHPKLGWPPLPFEKMRCSMVKAQYWSLPSNLEAAAAVLRLTEQKDTIGKALINLACKPNKKTGEMLDPFDCTNFIYSVPGYSAKRCGHQILELLTAYCMQDVETERALSNTLPDIPENELELWRIDQAINNRGIKVDVEMAEAANELVRHAVDDCNRELTRLTNGHCNRVTQVEKVFRYCHVNGYRFDSLQAPDIQIAMDAHDAGTHTMHPIARKVIELRQKGSKTPLKKYDKALKTINAEHIMRGNLRFYGAVSSRWTGSGFQFQNMPRPAPGFQVKEDVLEAVDCIKNYDWDSFKARYPDPTIALASTIRSLIIPRDDNVFVCADYSQIEARVNSWMVNDTRKLELFKSGGDPYVKMAKAIYGWLTDEQWDAYGKDDKSVMRDMGKRAELGLGYGMGDETYQATLRKQAHKEYALEFCTHVVDIYRQENYLIKESWYAYLDAAKDAVENRRSREQAREVNGVLFYMVARPGVISYLVMELRSGSKIFFANPSIKMITFNERTSPTLCYQGKHPITKKWATVSTHGGMFCGINCQATARDIMVHGLRNVVKAGYDPILLVHDEILSERKLIESNLDEYIGLLTDLPDWAKGLPIKADGWIGDRYMKG